LFIYNGSVRGRLSGGEYAYKEIRQALKSKFTVRELILDDILDRLLPGAPAFARRVAKRTCLVGLVMLSCFLVGRYDLVVTTWTPEVPFCGDISYVQPPPSKSEALFGDIDSSTNLIESFGKLSVTVWMRLLARVSLSRQTLVANSAFCKRMIEEQLGKSACVVYPPVPIRPLVETDKRENVVLTISRVSPEKNLRAISEIGPQVPEARFLLLGPLGPGGESTISLIKESFATKGLEDHFQYMGWVPEERKNQFLTTAKVLFHPARNESFGIAIAEAMSQGVIPIVHNSGAPKEWVPLECLFDDYDEAVRKIREALTNWSPAIASKLHELSLPFAERRFIDEFTAIFEAVGSRKSHSRVSGRVERTGRLQIQAEIGYDGARCLPETAREKRAAFRFSPAKNLRLKRQEV